MHLVDRFQGERMTLAGIDLANSTTEQVDHLEQLFLVGVVGVTVQNVCSDHHPQTDAKIDSGVELFNFTREQLYFAHLLVFYK